jgi:dextranase
MKNSVLGLLCTWCIFVIACNKPSIIDNSQLKSLNTATALNPLNLVTDKAFYRPCETVRFTLSGSLPAGANVRYKSYGNIISTVPLISNTWTWVPPADDFSGYMAEIFGMVNGVENVYYTIGIDVSSDPARFVRNGFLSGYGAMGNDSIKNVMARLNRLHVNYVQFQDWQYDHQKPLAGTVSSPDAVWKDIINRSNYQSTVLNYLSAAHGYNMFCLHYNLAYGALNNAAADGVLDQWYLYKDANHTTRDVHVLNAPFRSSIYITNPGNTDWQNFIASKTADVYKVYPFDGYQIDQLGGRGTLYNYNGTITDISNGFNPFINAMKTASPDKRLVMNAVGQFGQSKIATAPVDFLYTEVWDPLSSFSDLANVITNNDNMVNGTKSTVLAAYMNYSYNATGTYFNTPGVLFADAVIFAFGGSHLELGEHMLSKEYFPNNKLKMTTELSYCMYNYYDFLTAYENLLRGGGTFITPALRAGDNQLSLNNWPPVSGKTAVVAKRLGNRDIIHLINLANANSLKWRDDNGTQARPVTVVSPKFNFTPTRSVQRIWMASPDIDGGASKEIPFTVAGSEITFTLPSLQYWDMIVVEY